MLQKISIIVLALLISACASTKGPTITDRPVNIDRVIFEPCGNLLKIERAEWEHVLDVSIVNAKTFTDCKDAKAKSDALLMQFSNKEAK